MVDRNLSYILPTRASLHVYPGKDLTNQRVFEQLDEMDIAYEAREDGIYAGFEEEAEDYDRPLTYHLRIVPEDDFFLFHTHDRINAAYLSQFAEGLAPDLLEVEEAQSTGTYTLGHVHPSLTLNLIADLLPDAEYITENEEEPTRLECEYEGTTYTIFTDFEVVADETAPAQFHEFVDNLNERLATRLPESPASFDIDHLPNGWFDPLVANYPDLTDELGTIDPKDEEPFADLFDQTDVVAPNDASVIAIETLGALLFAIHDLSSEERLAYFDAYAETNTLLGEAFEIEDEPPVTRDEFARRPFWSPEVEEGIYADRNRYIEMKSAASSYADLDLEAGQIWRFRDPSASETVTVRLVEHGSLPDEEFPHLPVWIGSVEEATQESEFETGEPLVVHGENLIERVDD